MCKAIPHLNEVRRYAHAHGLPHFFLKDLMKAEKIHENTVSCIKEAGWIAGQIVRSNSQQIEGVNRLIELFKLKWISDKNSNPVTTANPWLLYEQLHHHLRERRGEVMLLSIDFNNDSGIHDTDYSTKISGEGEE
ncbi:MAG: hypothetical protein NVSMB66_7590 [Candidatus Doudnabacteria bacterium]